MKSLTIISHTEHFRTAEGKIVGLGSTITEINHLSKIFDEIHHIAMLHNGEAPASAMPYDSNTITFIPIAAVGGPNFISKLNILWQAIKILRTVKSDLKEIHYFQFRAPTGIGVFLIPYLVLFCKKKGWFKYAGNWKQHQAPISYQFQRWLLKNQKRIVTINGAWPKQLNQCLTFENPCLTQMEVNEGHSLRLKKTFDSNGINFCFVGRLEDEKGIRLLIRAFELLSDSDKQKVNNIHIVGDGKAKQEYIDLTDKLNLNFVFHGFMSRNDVQAIYKKSHAIILPSASEGFPKVIAEGMNFGCIPIVSNISGIGHYVKNGINGFLLDTITADSLLVELKHILILSPDNYREMITSNMNKMDRFTYTFYNTRIVNEILI